MILRKFLIVMAAMLAAVPATAQEPEGQSIGDTEKAQVVRTLGEKLRSSYVFPEVAERAAAELENRVRAGRYAEFTTPQTFADALRTDLREVGDDRHFQVRYNPQFVERPHESGAPSEEDLAQMQREMAAESYGIYRTAKLPGNIGYLDVRFFGPTEFVAAGYESAMQMLAGSNAIIVDLRSNGGGDPDSVARLVSHFFARGDERLINSIYNRPENTTRDYWLDRSVKTRFTGPVFILTSDYTFSGGEEFAYDMQTQKRAVLIGETTGGGANPGGPVALGHGLVAFIPTGRAINPITKTNWEHVGVVPDHAVTAEEAMAFAYRMAAQGVADGEPDPPTKAEYQALADADPMTIAEMPRWKHPRE